MKCEIKQCNCKAKYRFLNKNLCYDCSYDYIKENLLEKLVDNYLINNAEQLDGSEN